MKRILFCLIAAIVVFGLSGSVMAGLIDRGSFAYDDGASHTGFVNLIYDDDFDITWVGDGNFAMTTGYDADGLMTWDAAKTWSGGLTIGGFSDWRLPTALNRNGTVPVSVVEEVVNGGEMNHLFYGELGGTALSPISSSIDPDLRLFPNLKDSFYWSGTESAILVIDAWRFSFSYGEQLPWYQLYDFYGLAVRSGNVVASGNVDASDNPAPVPEPTTIALLGIGLAGMAAYGVRRRRQRRPQVK